MSDGQVGLVVQLPQNALPSVVRECGNHEVRVASNLLWRRWRSGVQATVQMVTAIQDKVPAVTVRQRGGSKLFRAHAPSRSQRVFRSQRAPFACRGATGTLGQAGQPEGVEDGTHWAHISIGSVPAAQALPVEL